MVFDAIFNCEGLIFFWQDHIAQEWILYLPMPIKFPYFQIMEIFVMDSKYFRKNFFSWFWPKK